MYNSFILSGYRSASSLKNNFQLQLNDNIKLEDLDFLDKVELDNNMVVAGNNPSEHIPIGQDFPSGSTKPYDIIDFEFGQSNNPNNEPNAEVFATNAMADSDMDVSSGDLPPVSDDSIPDMNRFVKGNNPSEHIAVGQDFPPGSTQPYELIDFESGQSNNPNQPNAELFATDTIADSDMDVSSGGLLPVSDPIPDMNRFVDDTVRQRPDELNGFTTAIQPITRQHFNAPRKMTLRHFFNQPRCVQRNNFFQQQLPVLPQADPSTYPELKFIRGPNNNSVLVLCKKEDLLARQAPATNSLVGTTSSSAPISHQIQGAVRPSNEYIRNPVPIQSNPGPSNVPWLTLANPVRFNPFQPMPGPGTPVSFGETIPNWPTQGMGSFVQNFCLAPSNPVFTISPRGSYRQIIPAMEYHPEEPQPLDYGFQTETITTEASVPQSAELILTTTTKDVTEDLSKYINNNRHKKSCRCTKSKCLKLYCECFVGSVFCQKSCKCSNCFNNLEHEQERSEVLHSILDRNPNAFKRRIGKSITEHKKGCKCKRSNCLKRYCECYLGNIPCSGNCKCVDCKNRRTDDDLNEDEPIEIDDDVSKPKEETSFNSSSDGRKEEKMPMNITSLFTDKVINSVCDSMLLKGLQHPGNEREQLMKSMEEFSNCFNEIRAAHGQMTARDNENKNPVKKPKKKSKKDE